ncbi:MAG: hypothetical protein JXB85_15005 [Anaerolineales bacterium]|nr:hypothetical protein [Anaerolineales bacterium]
MEELVFPRRGQDHERPFEQEFFDAVIAGNALCFCAITDTSLSWYLIPLVKPGDQFRTETPGTWPPGGRSTG